MKVTRNLIREYYGIPAGDAFAYHYVNAGFVKCNEENNPKVDKATFVGDVNATCAVTGLIDEALGEGAVLRISGGRPVNLPLAVEWLAALAGEAAEHCADAALTEDGACG